MLIFGQRLKSVFNFRDSQRRPRERGELRASCNFSVSMSLRRGTRQARRNSGSDFTRVAAGMRERLQYNHLPQAIAIQTFVFHSGKVPNLCKGVEWHCQPLRSNLGGQRFELETNGPEDFFLLAGPVPTPLK